MRSKINCVARLAGAASLYGLDDASVSDGVPDHVGPGGKVTRRFNDQLLLCGDRGYRPHGVGSGALGRVLMVADPRREITTLQP